MSEAVLKKIDQEVKTNPIILYVKGTKDFPRCGFSASTIEAFKSLNVPFETRDVLSDPGLWDHLEDYSHWPTFPQVFIGGKFVGGCDITLELMENGELKKLVDQALFKK